MEYLIFNVIVPLVVAGILMSIVFTIVRIILDIFHIGFYATKMVGFFAVYYFVGPYVYNILGKYISGGFPFLVKFLYMPIQVILSIFK